MNEPNPGSRTVKMLGTPCGICGLPLAALWLVEGKTPVPLHATDDGYQPCGAGTKFVVLVTRSLPYE